ncbi:uncharacterized protein I303_100273 [Kwoniella dejecticola CBS 10117]|uniref:Uncharacterized protein n=1 Tax=Kwoniella dejecticola CBS 10117 TaxID=1296121 RepID=A0A1A6AEF6_9TREE|nr:uncharacterized protein I303_00274 [Kwoniella dejecticola CBS 10117]OBR88457.1 hypothetical protein I303_00274 [Kwoniella dejecticola CBS 10117]
MVPRPILAFLALFSVVYAQSYIGCVDNIPSDTDHVEVNGDCTTSCKDAGYEYSFWEKWEGDCACGNTPPKTFMYNICEDEYGACLPYHHSVTKIHLAFQFHLCTKTIDLPSSSSMKSRTSIVKQMAECFDSCPEADYVAIAPQWTKGTYECKCGGMPVSYDPVICGEGTVYGYSNPSSKGNKKKSQGKAVAAAGSKAKAKLDAKAKAKVQAQAKEAPATGSKGGKGRVKGKSDTHRAGKQQVEKVVPVPIKKTGGTEFSRDHGL